MKALRSVYRWASRRPAYMLLTAGDHRISTEPPQRFGRAWIGVMVLSLLCGALLVNVWGLAWMVFADFGILIMPAVATVTVLVLWPLRRGVAALADILGRGERGGRSVCGVVIVVVLTMALASLHSGGGHWRPTLPDWIGWIHLDYRLYRVLLLMPIWGGWAMLIVGQFRRPDERTEPAVTAFVRGCGPVAAAGCMGVILVATVLYFYYDFRPETHWTLCGVSALTAIAGGLLLGRLTGGLKLRTLLATNVLTQTTFLLAYLAVQE